MKVIMTRYFYPIKMGGTEKFFEEIYFDNPRTEEELEYVANYLKMVNEPKINCNSNDPFWQPIEKEDIWNGIDTFYENHKEDILVGDYYSKIKKLKNVYIALAEMWVIIRCNKLIDTVAKNKTIYCGNGKKEQLDSVSTINSYNVDKIDKYLKFLSFMTISEEEPLNSIIINNSYVPPSYLPSFFFGKLYITTKSKNYEEINFLGCSFPDLWMKFKYFINLMNPKINDEKFLYICDVISNFGELRSNKKMYLLSVIGVMELLLTHNPDKSIYNIEDSITKQFVRKMKYILYKENHSIDLVKLEKLLKLAYTIRSNIAHGNFGKENDKILTKLSENYGLHSNDENEFFYHTLEDSIDFLNVDLTFYLKKTLEMYLISEDELNLLKDL